MIICANHRGAREMPEGARFSPRGRRWRAAPDEGSGNDSRFLRRPTDKLSDPSSGLRPPSPQGRRKKRQRLTENDITGFTAGGLQAPLRRRQSPGNRNDGAPSQWPMVRHRPRPCPTPPPCGSQAHKASPEAARPHKSLVVESCPEKAGEALVTASRSVFSDGQRFWLETVMPSSTSTIVARQLGVAVVPAPTVTSAFGSSRPEANTPRGRCSLKERPTSITPLAMRARRSYRPDGRDKPRHQR